MDFKQLFLRFALLLPGVFAATFLSSGISHQDTASLLFAVLLLTIFNALLKPLLVLFSLPFIVLTAGIGIWLINALILLLVGAIIPGFAVDGFGSALLGALIISLMTGLVSALVRSAGPGEVRQVRFQVQRGIRPPGQGPTQTSDQPRPRVQNKRDDDVIDI